jgi:hypothetical protein
MASEPYAVDATNLHYVQCMFDASYFKNQLAKDVEAAGGSPIVEVLLLSGHSRRVRSVERTQDGYVLLEVFHLRGDQALLGAHWQQSGKAGDGRETYRAAVSYEAIAEVLIDQAPAAVDRKLGFMS